MPDKTAASAGLHDPLPLYWLPAAEDWSDRIKVLEAEIDPNAAWNRALTLASFRADFIRTCRLDRTIRRLSEASSEVLNGKRIRLAILGSSTVAHLVPAIRVACARRGILASIYEAEYGQYLQELNDTSSGLHQFVPTAILFAIDTYHLTNASTESAASLADKHATDEVLDRLVDCWRLAHNAFQCHVIQQTALPLFPALLGNNEHRSPGSRYSRVTIFNNRVRVVADESNVDLLAIDARAAQDGVALWHDPVLWHRAKQEISPSAALQYGDLVARLLAARQGRSYKCAVLDLDNTLWGGVIGDDGLEGIVLGQGSALGEAFVCFQEYLWDLGHRGVILAVCSKNDESNALAPFDRHPEMVLKRDEIASFRTNWDDKPANIRAIAQSLNIGLDSLVCIDDNPFERSLVRRELPMVAVPEMPEDPALFACCIADAGYFESVALTEEDQQRTRQYQTNNARDVLTRQSTDMPTYLRSLQMRLLWREFDVVGLQRIVQLINKTNQFNLTTRRYTEAEVLAVMNDNRKFGLQFRLTDKFGDNGIIAIIIGTSEQTPEEIRLDSWLMSCRVLGRHVEEATLAVAVDLARSVGAVRLVGDYYPTSKNEMVKEHYAKLGFTAVETRGDGGSRSVLDLSQYRPPELFMAIQRENHSD